MHHLIDVRTFTTALLITEYNYKYKWYDFLSSYIDSQLPWRKCHYNHHFAKKKEVSLESGSDLLSTIHGTGTVSTSAVGEEVHLDIYLYKQLCDPVPVLANALGPRFPRFHLPKRLSSFGILWVCWREYNLHCSGVRWDVWYTLALSQPSGICSH